MKKRAQYIIKGMNRDLSVSKASSEFSFENMNIRISARDNNTLLSITNERGTKEVSLNEDINKGVLLGYCVLNNYIVLFIKGDTDYIYRIEYLNSEYTVKLLYNGDLGFNEDYPIETLGIYENEKVQKIYWVDGVNQPRYINIVAPDSVIENWRDKSFDFVREIGLHEQVTITKKSANYNNFPSGIIQYALSYYNVYGSESTIFYTSPLYYLNIGDRGASPEETANCIFNIKVDNPDRSFDYLRIYSIIRTSIDATPEVKRVIDINLSTSSDGVSYTDNGSVGDSIDPTELLYKGGDVLSAYTMTQKDNTLFLGNINLKTKTINEDIRSELRSLSNSIVFEPDNLTYSDKHIYLPDPNSYYPYQNQLSYNSKQIKIFKYLEWYRFGLQFQDKNGKWSEAIFIGDKQNTIPTNTILSTAPGRLRTAIPQVTISKFILQKIFDEGFIRVRPIIVYPSISDRECICQGVLCPTVYNVGDRYSNSPFVQSSWFVRPNSAYDIEKSSIVEREYENLFSCLSELGDGFLQKNLEPGTKYRTGSVEMSLISATEVEATEGNYYYRFTLDKGDNTTQLPAKGMIELVEQSGGYQNTISYTEGINDHQETTTNSQNLKDRDTGILPSVNSRAGVILNNKIIVHIEDTQAILNPTLRGTWAEFRHNNPIPSNNDRKAEIQCIWNPPSNPYVTALNSDSISEWVSNNKENFYIDQSIVTLHSPDIEFGDLNIDNLDLKLRIIGIVPITGFYGDIDIQTSTPVNNYKTITDELPMGFYKLNISAMNVSRFGWKGLMSGAFWVDEVYNKDPEVSTNTGFVVYPWHRNGSLNNAKIAKDGGNRPALLDQKRISNLRVSFNTYYLDRNNIWNSYVYGSSTKTGISGVKIFNSEEVSLLQLPSPDNSTLSTISYYGNIDKLLYITRTGDKSDGYPIVATNSQSTTLPISNLFYDSYKTMEELNVGTYDNTGTDPVSMRYKSTPHAVMALNYTSDGKQNILPTLKDGDIGGDRWNVNYQGIETTVSNSYAFWDTESFKGINQDVLDLYFTSSGLGISLSPIGSGFEYGFLWLGELYNDNVVNRFGGSSSEAIENNIWMPCGDIYNIIKTEGTSTVVSDLTVKWEEGDTYYQRYDHIKTYPFSLEEQNAVTDIISFMCETRINIDGRYDKNRGQLTNFAITPENFNKLNPVYSQKNNFFTYRTLNYNLFNINKFPNSVIWSKEKSLGETIDNWSNISTASILELDGDKGGITSLNTFNNEIFCFQRKGISNIIFNPRTQIPVSDGVPIEISNGGKVSGKRYVTNNIGCSNKWSIAESSRGLYFIDELTNALYLFNGKIDTLSDKLGFRQWISEHASNSFKSFIDKTNDDVYFVSKDYCLCYSELLGQFTSFMSYEDTPAMFNIEDKFVSFKNGKLWENNQGDYNMFYGEFKPYYIIYRITPDGVTDKIFNNIEFRVDTWDNDTLVNKTFNVLEVWNEYQRGSVDLTSIQNKPSPLKEKFRIWRANIPRDSTNNRDRIRNPWIYLKLEMNDNNIFRTELHDLLVYYFE